jgi:hypothetical protein
MNTTLFTQNNDVSTINTQPAINPPTDNIIVSLSTDDLVSTAGGSTADWW